MNGQNRNKEKLNGNKSQGKKRENKLTSAENGANFELQRSAAVGSYELYDVEIEKMSRFTLYNQ